MKSINILANEYIYRNFSIVSFRVLTRYSINFITLVMLTSIISPYEYGLIAFVSTIIGLFTFFGITGLDTVIMRNISQGKDYVYLPSIRRSFSFSILVLPVFLTIGIYYHFVDEERVISYSLFSLSLFIPLLYTLRKSTAFFTGKKHFLRISFFTILLSTNGLVSLFIFVFYNLEIWHYIFLLHFISFLFYALFFYSSLKHIENPLIKPSKLGYIEDEISYGFTLSKIGLFSQIVSYLDKIIVALFSGLTSLATYAIAKRFFDLVTETIRGLVAIPTMKLAELSASDYLKKLRFYAPLTFGFSVLFYFLITFVSKHFIEFFFPSYLAAVDYLQLLCIVFIFQPCNRLYGRYFELTKKSNTLFFMTLSANLIKFVCYFVFYFFFGVIGIIYSYILVSIYVFITQIYLTSINTLSLEDYKFLG